MQHLVRSDAAVAGDGHTVKVGGEGMISSSNVKQMAIGV